MLGLFKFLTVLFGIVAAICLIGLTDTTHQMFGPEVGAVLAVALILFVLSGMAWTLGGKTEQKGSTDKSANATTASELATHIPSTEAARILRRWYEEKQRIRFHIYHKPDEETDCLCSGVGWIDELPTFIVHISERDDGAVIRGDRRGCVVSLSRATAFVVPDRQAPNPEFKSNSSENGCEPSLTIEFRSGARCDLQPVAPLFLNQ
jgi:hypothetical protein